MRTLMIATLPVDAGNKALKDGSLPKIIEGVLGEVKPEAAYFGSRDGKRTMFVVFDMKDSSDMPRISEPLFMGLNAEVTFTPVMSPEDLKAGLGKMKL